MLHRKKTYIVGDRVLVNKRQGTIKYIGELRSSNKIWVGVCLNFKKRNVKKQLLQPEESISSGEEQPELQTKNNYSNNQADVEFITNGTIDNTIYIENKNNKNNIIFIEPSKINKWFQGVDNKHLSRQFHIHQQIWIKPIKCKGIIKSMFYNTPKYILKQINQPKGKQYLGLLLNKPFGNNINNTTKYFECEDNYDYFVKTNSKQIIPLNEYNERLSSYNLELIIDHWCRQYFDNVQLARELIRLLISFFGAMDGALILKTNEVHKYSEQCLHFEDYYEYDSVRLGEGSRLIGGKLICIKCFGNFIMEETAEISVSASVDLDYHYSEKNILKFGAKGFEGGKGGGIIKIVCFGKVIIGKNALIQANGEDGNLVAGYGGGGTIYIKCKKLINYGKIIAVGCNNTGPIYHDVWRVERWQKGNGPDGQIIIDGEYSEYGCSPINSLYCGPILMPDYILHRKSYGF
eukprot:480872_1